MIERVILDEQSRIRLDQKVEDAQFISELVVKLRPDIRTDIEIYHAVDVAIRIYSEAKKQLGGINDN